MNTKKYQSYYDQFPFVDKLRAERRENVLTKLVLALACALLVAIFALQNAGKVVVAFLLWHFEVSLALVILGSTLLGAVFVFLFRTGAADKPGKKDQGVPPADQGTGGAACGSVGKGRITAPGP